MAKNCIDIVPHLKGKFDAKIKSGMPEMDALLNVVKEEQEAIFKSLNKLKKAVGLKTIGYKEPSFIGEIKAINEKANAELKALEQLLGKPTEKSSEVDNKNDNSNPKNIQNEAEQHGEESIGGEQSSSDTEGVVTDIESKAESTSKVENAKAVKKADEVIDTTIKQKKKRKELVKKVAKKVQEIVGLKRANMKEQKEDAISQLQKIEDILFAETSYSEEEKANIREQVIKGTGGFNHPFGNTSSNVELLRKNGVNIDANGQITISVKDNGNFSFASDAIIEAINIIQKSFPSTETMTIRSQSRAIAMRRNGNYQLALDRGSLERNQIYVDVAQSNIDEATSVLEQAKKDKDIGTQKTAQKLVDLFKEELDYQKSILEQAERIDYDVETNKELKEIAKDLDVNGRHLLDALNKYNLPLNKSNATKAIFAEQLVSDYGSIDKAEYGIGKAIMGAELGLEKFKYKNGKQGFRQPKNNAEQVEFNRLKNTYKQLQEQNKLYDKIKNDLLALSETKDKTANIENATSLEISDALREKHGDKIKTDELQKLINSNEVVVIPTTESRNLYHLKSEKNPNFKDYGGNLKNATETAIKDDENQKETVRQAVQQGLPMFRFSTDEKTKVFNGESKVPATKERIQKTYPDAIVVQSENELPEAIVNEINKQQQNGKVKGVEYNGKIYLVADNIKTMGEAEATYRHEVLGHKGVIEKLGKALDKFATSVIEKANASQNVVIKQLLKDYFGGRELSSLSEKEKSKLGQEYIAKIAETKTKYPNTWTRIKLEIKKLFRTLGLPTNISDKEIQYLINQVERSSKNKNNQNNSVNLQTNETKETILKRLTPEEEQGRIRSGEVNAEATILTEAVHRAVKSKFGDKVFIDNEIRDAEEKYIENYAKDKGIWADNVNKEFGVNPDSNGQEQNVYYSEDGTMATKTNSGVMHNNWLEYFDRLAIHATLFPSSAYTLKGFGKDSNGRFVAIVEQPFIHGKRTTYAKIEKYMNERGYFNTDDGYGQINKENFRNEETGVLVEDLHLGNVIEGEDGNLFVFDPIIYLDTEEKGYGGTRKPNTKDIKNEDSSDGIGERDETRFANIQTNILGGVEGNSEEENSDIGQKAKSVYQKKLELELAERRQAYADVKKAETGQKRNETKNTKTIKGFLGKITSPFTAEHTEKKKAELADIIKKTKEAKRDLRKGVPIERGANWIIEKLSKAVRNGDIEQEQADLAIDLVRANPIIFKDLGISVTQSNDENINGYYNSWQQIVKIFKGNSDTLTAVHELLHHTERFLPLDIRLKIIKEWHNQVEIQYKDIYKKLQNETNESKRFELTTALLYLDLAVASQKEPYNSRNTEDINDLMKKYLHGFTDEKGKPFKGLGKSFYTLYNPSEWWAVNASQIMQKNKNNPLAKTWIDKVAKFYNQLLKSAKNILGYNPTKYVEKGIKAILNGETLDTQYGSMLADLGLNFSIRRSTEPVTPEEIQKAIDEVQERVKTYNTDDSFTNEFELIDALDTLANTSFKDAEKIIDTLPKELQDYAKEVVALSEKTEQKEKQDEKKVDSKRKHLIGLMGFSKFADSTKNEKLLKQITSITSSEVEEKNVLGEYTEADLETMQKIADEDTLALKQSIESQNYGEDWIDTFLSAIEENNLLNSEQKESFKLNPIRLIGVTNNIAVLLSQVRQGVLSENEINNLMVQRERLHTIINAVSRESALTLNARRNFRGIFELGQSIDIDSKIAGTILPTQKIAELEKIQQLLNEEISDEELNNSKPAKKTKSTATTTQKTTTTKTTNKALRDMLKNVKLPQEFNDMINELKSKCK